MSFTGDRHLFAGSREMRLVACRFLPEQIVVVDEMMMSDISKLGLARTGKLEDNSIGSVDPKTPDLVMLGM